MMHEKKNVCGATGGAFSIFHQSIIRSSAIGRQNERVKMSASSGARSHRGGEAAAGDAATQLAEWLQLPPCAAAAGGGWAARPGVHWWRRGCTVAVQRQRCGRRGCHVACEVAALTAVRRRCNATAQVRRRYAHPLRGQQKFRFSVPYSAAIQFFVLIMSGGKTTVMLNGGFPAASKCLRL